ncbi:MAG: ATP-binding protein [Polyangiaceae bacterium]
MHARGTNEGAPGTDTREGPYAAVMKKLMVAQFAWAASIYVLTVVECRSWRAAAICGGLFVVLLPFNAWVTSRLLPARGEVFGEVVRFVGNCGTQVLMAHLLDWPMAAWAWLPFNAAAYDSVRPRLANGILIATMAANVAAAAADGVPWKIVVVFCFVAIASRLLVDLRMKAAYTMWLRSEAQRSELDLAHSQLQIEVRARERAERSLRQSQKLEAVGRLAAGIAHEINNPLQFLGNNLTFLEESFRTIDARLGPTTAGTGDDALATLRSDVHESIADAHDGVARIRSIVLAMNEFARPTRNRTEPFDLTRAIESTLVVTKHAYARAAQVTTDLATLPLVEGDAGAFSQVLVNLIVNAAQALEPKLAESARLDGKIGIRTWTADGSVFVSVSDNGPGIPEAVREHVFEPFFTTKPAGQGTGQGLAIARSVVEEHGGALTFESAEGVGTTFVIRLPLKQEGSPR